MVHEKEEFDFPQLDDIYSSDVVSSGCVMWEEKGAC